MVCTANELSAWKDFPKGLRVLLIDEDNSSAAEIKSKLEAMDYIVSRFCNENEALSSISNKPESFHIAIVEVSTSIINGNFKFLETAKDLPTIMTSNIHCLNTMMKCVALGAVEFLQKPLSEDKLRNIWQHVVHKAFSAGERATSDSLNAVKDSVVSTLQLKVKIEETKDEEMETAENMSLDDESNCEHSPGSDKYPAPSTPQLKQGGRSLDDGDCQDLTNCSTEKEGGEKEGECQFVETTNIIVDEILQEDNLQSSRKMVIKKEDDLADGIETGNNIILNELQNKESLKNSNNGAHPSKPSGLNNSCGTARASRKKMKVDWTPELHKKFVQAVEQLGVDQAIPSRILELMKVEGLTRHNVASHLQALLLSKQKYRMHRRHILPKEDVQRWPQQRDQIPRSYYPQKPIMAYPPPYHLTSTFPPSPVYPMWGATNAHVAGAQMWGTPPNYAPWPPTESWHCNPHPGMYADAWGCPVIPPPQTYPTLPQNASGFPGPGMLDNDPCVPQKSIELHPAEEVIDKVVKEAISKPWLPLPLGLKPPSTDCVLAELSRQGISRTPPQSSTTT